MYSDLRFHSTWKYIEYLVPLLRSGENAVPNVTSYHNAKEFKHGNMSYFVGYGGNNECNIFEPADIENCVSANNNQLLLQRYLNKVEINTNK